ncbi:acetyl-CoA carboxylase biotin carboxyl carrier protein [Mobilisporobacter senegalensis]|uniref:Biotin carboxyl carrier protein of acetyl-CoA carboxylase n=1 Tax=Mobilisporobacter senegalensis TaxID=1329262 RepID=A0A3N1XKA3_9FIRM|nr:acetyl-CoA carboxylase biotin carboxyl carrier protein [Mobilisporobacter senegalensis]ROR27165.1 acetyl-CoA carboxylase biotin carboxyl carrier protein [Mobilisporobacter senegalensis]
MDMEQIITLINVVSKSSLSSFTLEEGNMKLSLEANRGVTFAEAPVKVNSSVVVNNNEEVNIVTEKPGKLITSPLVGTFYEAQAEGGKPYVQVGDTVKKGQIIGIVEAMKLMNHIESEYDGVVDEVLVSNEQMVEYGQPLIRIIENK